MLIKFIKAQFKTSQHQSSRINVLVKIQSSDCVYSIKAPRKVKERVANFYGETLQLQDNSQYFSITIKKFINQQVEQQTLMQIKINNNQNKKYTNWHYSTEENQNLKLFWAENHYLTQTCKLSRRSSDLSMNLAQFENLNRPEKDIMRQDYRIFSPVYKRKHRRLLSNEHGDRPFVIQEVCIESSPQQKNSPSINENKKLCLNLKKMNRNSDQNNGQKKLKTKQFSFKERNDQSSQLKGQKRIKQSNSPYLNNKLKEGQNKGFLNRRRTVSTISRAGAFFAGSLGLIAGLTAGYIQQ